MNKFFLTLLLLLALGSLTSVFAQAPGSTGPTPGSPAAVPLDGGASLLLASGVALGVRHLRQRWQSRA